MTIVLTSWSEGRPRGRRVVWAARNSSSRSLTPAPASIASASAMNFSTTGTRWNMSISPPVERVTTSAFLVLSSSSSASW
ncbi:MAG TPA: hypothetical protein VN493_09170 [Thermoanaerobaculia bacterium]|nr:hypothetical protein [Thermoanaerobaculia bacterium]